MIFKNRFFASVFILALGLVVSSYVLFPSQASAEWVQQTEAGPLTLQDLVLSPDGTRLIATGGNGASEGYVYISTNGGSTWIKQTEVGQLYLYYFTFSPDGTKLIASSPVSAYVYISTDGGLSWTKQTVAGELYFNLFAFSPDGTKIIAANNSNRYIYISSDGGSTWIQQTEAGPLWLYNLVSSPDGRLVGVSGSDGYVYISTDGGFTWIQQTGAGSLFLSNLAFSPDGTQLIATGGNDGYIYISTDGGSTWIKQTSLGSLSLYDFTFSPDGTKLVATKSNGWLVISTDGGLSWTEQTSDGQHSFYGFVFFLDEAKIIASSGGDRYVYIYSAPVADLTAYNQALSAVTRENYTTESWAIYQVIVNANVVIETNSQNEVDTATSNITDAQANLVRIVAPTVTTDIVTNTTSTTATLNAIITSSGGSDTVSGWFGYGLSEASIGNYSSHTEDGEYSESFSNVITGLTCATTYHYRAGVNNIAGSTSGEDMTFITGDCSEEIYVDDNYTNDGNNDGHEWGVDAFSTISEGIAAVLPGGIIRVATGTYSEEGTIIIKKTINLLGPGINVGDGNTALITNTAHTGQNPVLSIEASGVKVDGFYISGGSIGITLIHNANSSIISNNRIYNNLSYGINIGGSINNTVSQNDIHGNGSGINLSCDGNCAVNGAGGNVITYNNINNNSHEGVILQSNLNLNNSDVEISLNTITLNDGVGIKILTDTYGVSITGNTITNNEEGGIYTYSANKNSAYYNIISSNGSNNVGVDNNDNSVFNANYNYWGDPSGPQNWHNHDGNGSMVIGNVKYRPFYIDEARTTLSSNSIHDLDMSTLFSNGGSFSIPTAEGESINSTSQINVNEQLTISVDIDNGSSSVLLPAGTVITGSTGGLINASLITASDTPTSELSGLNSGVITEGALQWGIPGVGLSFSEPITLNIFVGTELNGQTLTVYRSLSKTSGWTSDGIVASKCKVSSGICSFQAIKASYYSVVKSHSNVGGSSGGLSQPQQQTTNSQALIPADSTIIPPAINPTIPNLTPTQLTTPIVTLSLVIKRIIKLNITGDDVKELQKYLNIHGFILASTGPGSLGHETTTFGPLTKKAVIAFQKTNGLVPDGIVGPKTLALMK